MTGLARIRMRPVVSVRNPPSGLRLAIGPFGQAGPAGYVPTDLVTSTDIDSIVALTQAEYDALSSPVATTLYLIRE